MLPPAVVRLTASVLPKETPAAEERVTEPELLMFKTEGSEAR